MLLDCLLFVALNRACRNFSDKVKLKMPIEDEHFKIDKI